MSLSPLLEEDGNGGAFRSRAILTDTRWKRRAVASSVRIGTFKLIEIESDYTGWVDQRLLFDLASDPGEQVDLSAVHPDKVAVLSGASERILASDQPAIEAESADDLDVESLRTADRRGGFALVLGAAIFLFGASGASANDADVSVAVGELPEGKKVRVLFDVTVNTGLGPRVMEIQNQGTVGSSSMAFGNLQTDDPDDATGDADPTVTPLDGLTIGNLVWLEKTGNSIFDPATADTGIDGLLVHLYLDDGDGWLNERSAECTPATPRIGEVRSMLEFPEPICRALRLPPPPSKAQAQVPVKPHCAAVDHPSRSPSNVHSKSAAVATGDADKLRQMASRERFLSNEWLF